MSAIGLIVIMLMEELTSIARRFYTLARNTSDPITKERLTTLADSYLEQAEQLKCQRTVAQAAYSASDTRSSRTNELTSRE